MFWGDWLMRGLDGFQLQLVFFFKKKIFCKVWCCGIGVVDSFFPLHFELIFVCKY